MIEILRSMFGVCESQAKELQPILLTILENLTEDKQRISMTLQEDLKMEVSQSKDLICQTMSLVETNTDRSMAVLTNLFALNEATIS